MKYLVARVSRCCDIYEPQKINFSIFLSLCCSELTIGFDAVSYEVVENERFVDVTIVMMGRTSRDVEVTLNTRDGTAVCEYFITY